MIIKFREKLKENEVKGYKFKGTWEANFGGSKKAEDGDYTFNPDPFEDVHQSDNTFRMMGMDVRRGFIDRYNMDGAINPPPKTTRQAKSRGPKKGEPFSQLFQDRKKPPGKKRGRKAKS